MSTVDDQVTKAVISSNLKRLLAEKGWSQSRLARETGDPIMTINSVFHAKAMPGCGIVARIAAALEVSVDELFSIDQKKTSKSA